MAIEVRLPELGENVESGQVVRVLVAVGDAVAKDQPILELETDKAAIEVPSTAAGVVRSIHFQVGDVVKVDQLLLTLEGEAALAAAPSAKKEAPAKAVPARAEPPAKGRESRAAAPAAGPAPRSMAERPATKTGDVVPSESPAAMDPLDTVPDEASDEGEVAPESSRPLVAAAPSVRRLARELGIDVNRVPGTGPGRRVSIEDLKAHARRILSGLDERRPSAPADGAAGAAVPTLPDFTEWGEVERRSMSNVRRLTAERMSRAWSVIPQVTQFDRADVTELEELRKRFTETNKARGVRLTLTPIVMKAAAIALGELPQLNASLDLERQEIVLKKYRHIAVAVDTDRGLLAPVIRDVDRKPLLALAREVEDLAKRAREKKIQVAELRGATFTVTNLGGIGGTGFSPIVNHPEVAVLGVARGDWSPKLRNGAFEPRLLLPLSLSYDHRIVDGADGARFLRRVCALLEDPLSWMLDPS